MQMDFECRNQDRQNDCRWAELYSSLEAFLEQRNKTREFFH